MPNQSATGLKERIRLVSIGEAPAAPRRAPSYAVTLALLNSEGVPRLEAHFTMAREAFDDADLTTVARHWFATLCKQVAEETADWVLSEEQFDALKKIMPE